MIEHDLVRVAELDRVVSLWPPGAVWRRWPHAHVTHDDVLHVFLVGRVEVTMDCDARAGRRLARDRDVTVCNLDVAFDHTRDVEHHVARSTRGARRRQAARARCGQAGHVDHASAASTAGDCAETDGVGERGQCQGGANFTAPCQRDDRYRKAACLHRDLLSKHRAYARLGCAHERHLDAA
jgi:hypothetical protein